MPKSKEKSQKKTKMSEEELSDLLKKSLKSKPADTEESDEEGEKPETNLDLQTLEFHNFFQSGGDSKAPVLERIAGSQVPKPIFVGGIPQGHATTTSNSETGDDSKYVPSTEQIGEATYTGSTHVEKGVERVDFSKVGRETRVIGGASMNVSDERISARENFGVSSQSFERADSIRQFDETKVGRDSAHDAKYQEYNPKKLPSGK